MFAAFLLWAVLSWHPIHLSHVQIDYNKSARTLEMAAHIFIDDLELALRKQGHDKLLLGTPREAPHAHRELTAYLLQHLQLDINGQRVPLRFIGKETSDDLQALWCYFEATMTQPGTLTVQCSWLTDIYADQRNVVALRQPGHAEQFQHFTQRTPSGVYTILP